MLIGFQEQKDGSEKALLYINSTAPHTFDPEKLLGMLKELVAILEAHLTQRATDVVESAASSGLYNCYVCGEDKCTEEQKLYLCKDCANGIVKEVVELIQDDRPADKA